MIPVTVLLRTLHAEPWLPDLLERILGQSHPPREILVVDSGSSDDTVTIARRAGARVVNLEPARFTHARSTNLGFREARGEVVAMLSQDALPADERWLERLVEPLADKTVAATFGRQIPQPGCFPVERWELERAYPERGEAGVPYSNVNSAARREMWRQLPFDESLSIAEDRVWALEVRARGLRIAYVPAAAVVHSHAYSLPEVYTRCREEARARRQAEGAREGWHLLWKAWPRQVLRDGSRLRREGLLHVWPRAAAYRFAQFAGMVAGGRA